MCGSSRGTLKQGIIGEPCGEGGILVASFRPKYWWIFFACVILALSEQRQWIRSLSNSSSRGPQIFIAPMNSEIEIIMQNWLYYGLSSSLYISRVKSSSIPAFPQWHKSCINENPHWNIFFHVTDTSKENIMCMNTWSYENNYLKFWKLVSS